MANLLSAYDALEVWKGILKNKIPIRHRTGATFKIVMLGRLEEARRLITESPTLCKLDGHWHFVTPSEPPVAVHLIEGITGTYGYFGFFSKHAEKKYVESRETVIEKEAELDTKANS